MDRTRALMSLALTCLAAPGIAQTYTLVDLGSLSGWTEARDLNEDQVVVGSSVNADFQSRGFVWDSYLSAVEPGAPMTQSEAMAINALSEVVVASYSMGDVTAAAVLVSGGDAFGIGSFVPRAINDAGEVAGTGESVGADGLVQNGAVLWADGVLTMLPKLAGGLDASALDIAGNGDVVGSAFASEALEPTAVLWRHGSVFPLGTLSGGSHAQATGISENSAYVCGVSGTATDHLRAFRYTLSGTSVVQRLDLGTLGGGWSVAYDANSSGEVVGTSDGRAFVYTGGQLADLNALVAAELGWHLIGATGINERGDIIGWGEHGADGLRAFLLVRPCSSADIAPIFGQLDERDPESFIRRLGDGDAATDIADEIGHLDLFDVLEYLRRFDEGCP